MTIQVKRLKAVLKELGIRENVHLTKYRRTCKNPDTKKTERFTEYGPAFSIVCKLRLTQLQIDAIKNHANCEVTYESDLFIHLES